MTAGVEDRARWQVYHDGELVGEIGEQEQDFPWIRGRFHPLAGFEQLRPLFDAWNRAVDSEDPELIDRVYGAIRAAVTMTYPDGRPVPEFMLAIEGDYAGFRWHDEPFTDE